jgi:hypothetical protein
MIAVSLLKLSALTFLIPALAIALTTYLLPFGLGNPHVIKRVGPKPATRGDGEEVFLVQVMLRPRIQHGLRALIEDADDFGWLRLNASGLVYEGDSLNLTVPSESIQHVRAQSIGWRGLFVYGPRCTLAIKGLPHITSIVFAERSSHLLPGSRRTAWQLCRRLRTLQPNASSMK